MAGRRSMDRGIGGGGLIAVLAIGGMVAVAALLFLGGQISTVLSTVGGRIPALGDAPDGAGRLGTATGTVAVDPGATAASQPVEPGGATFGSQAPLPQGAQLVHTGSLELVVEDVQRALERGRAAISAVGGYVGATRESGDSGTPVATITYRIPASQWSRGLASIRALGSKVVNEQTEATEVGDQVVDLEARIRNLRASELALQGIAAGAGKVTDLLEVERQLSAVRDEIERLDAQRARLSDQVAYGTLVTTFGLKVEAVVVAAEEWDPARDVDQATATLLSIVQGIGTAAIWFAIVWLPFLSLLVVALLVARWAARWYERRRGGTGGTGVTPSAIPRWDES